MEEKKCIHINWGLFGGIKSFLGIASGVVLHQYLIADREFGMSGDVVILIVNFHSDVRRIAVLYRNHIITFRKHNKIVWRAWKT